MRAFTMRGGERERERARWRDNEFDILYDRSDPIRPEGSARHANIFQLPFPNLPALPDRFASPSETSAPIQMFRCLPVTEEPFI